MFINPRKFKSYIKKTYNSTLGLWIAHDRSGLIVIDASFLHIEADLQESTKEFRAAIIEVCGRIPEEGEAVTFCKDGEQESVLETRHKQLFTREAKKTDKVFERTPLILGTNILMQAEDGEIIMINDAAFSIFAPHNTVKGEFAPDAWKVVHYGMVATRSATMLMGLQVIPPMYSGEHSILDALINTKLNYKTLEEDRL